MDSFVLKLFSYSSASMIRFLAVVCFLTFNFCHEAEGRYYPQARWRTLRTNAFTIYYPEGHEAFAARVLALADEVESDVQEYFGYDPGRLAVVLNPYTDIFNGYYAAVPHRIVLFGAPMSDLKFAGEPASDLMDLLFSHEYTHFVHISMARGWYRGVTAVIGRGLRFFNAAAPWWVTEGVAVDLETRLTDGGRGTSPYFRGRITSFAERGGLWGLTASGSHALYSPPPGRIYLSGYFMVDYMNRTYGMDSLKRLSAYQSSNPLRGTGPALRHVTGRPHDVFYSEYLADFNSMVDSIKTASKAAGLEEGRTVYLGELDGINTYNWTNKNTIYALRRGYNSLNALIELDKTGKIIAEHETGRLFVLSNTLTPDGKIISGTIFVHPLGGGNIDVTDLTVLDPFEGTRTRITRNAQIFEGDMSAINGLFASVRRRGMWMDLNIIDMDGNIRAITDSEGLYFQAPAWSPDGYVVASAVKYEGYNGIAMLDPKGFNEGIIFEYDTFGANDPTFSPDGRWLVFTSTRDGNWNVYALNLENRGLFQLTSLPYGAYQPEISKDGSTLAFLTWNRGLKELRIMPFDPSGGIEIESAPSVPFDSVVKRNTANLELNSRGIPVFEAYRPFIHAPYLTEDIDNIGIGGFFMGGDPVGLNSYIASVSYGLESEILGYDITLANRSFWPTIGVRTYNRVQRSGFVLDGEDLWERERGTEFGLASSVMHSTSPRLVSAVYSGGVRTRRYEGIAPLAYDPDGDETFSFFGGMALSNLPERPARDMVPGWGNGIFVSREQQLLIFGGETEGHVTNLGLTQFAPSPLRHHGFEFRLLHQNQSGPFIYSGSPFVPRGYSDSDPEGGLDLRNLLTLSANYRFPLAFPDRGVGLYFLHAHLIRGSLFADHGAGWEGGFDANEWGRDARTSIGGTVSVVFDLFSVIPLEMGVVAGYKTRERENFAGIFVLPGFYGIYGHYYKKTWLPDVRKKMVLF